MNIGQGDIRYTKTFVMYRSTYVVTAAIGTLAQIIHDFNFSSLPEGGFYIVDLHYTWIIRDNAAVDIYFNHFDNRVVAYVVIDTAGSGLPMGDSEGGIALSAGYVNTSFIVEQPQDQNFSRSPLYVPGFQCRLVPSMVVSNYVPTGVMEYLSGGYVTFGFKDDPEKANLIMEDVL